MENKRVLTPEEEFKIKNHPHPDYRKEMIRSLMLRNPNSSFESVAKVVDGLSDIHGF